jgi:hypothetical protein
MRVIVDHPYDGVGDSGVILEVVGLGDYEHTVVRASLAKEVLS